MEEKYGFVYIWRDRKHKRYYVGSHWGTEHDGYISSSTWMKQAYSKRPSDFKRRIISKILSSKKELLLKEYEWLSLIKKEELGKRYYNLNIIWEHWNLDPERATSTIKKMANSLKKMAARMSPEERSKKFGYWKGKKYPEEYKAKKRLQKPWNAGLKDCYTLSEEHKRKIGLKGLGRKHTAEARTKMSEIAVKKYKDSLEREKLSLRFKGRISITDGIHNKKIYPNQEIPIGFHRGFTRKTGKRIKWIS